MPYFGQAFGKNSIRPKAFANEMGVDAMGSMVYGGEAYRCRPFVSNFLIFLLDVTMGG